MNALASFAAAFCSVSVLTAALCLLCPTGRLEKAVKYVFALVFMLTVITALPNFKSIKLKVPQREEYIQNESINEGIIESVFRAALKNGKIEFTDLTVCTDKSEDGSIIIKRVTVYTDADPMTVKNILGGDEAEYAVEVISG